jgi:FlaA1/EpsC-like NDP-sugar epimerase
MPMRRLNHPAYRHRALQFLADAVLVAAAFALAFVLRFLDVGGIPERYQDMLWQSIAFVAVGKALIFTLLGLHSKWWRYFLTRDFPALLRATALASAAMVVVFTVLQPFDYNLPRSIVIFDFILTTGLLAGARIVTRLWIERPSKAMRERKTRGSLIVGAGSGGQMVVRELQLNPALGVRAIGFVDDDPRKRGMGLLGLRVLGTTDQIAELLEKHKPDEVVIAIPSAPGELRAKVVAACRERHIPVRTLPTVFELLRGGVQLTRQLREVQVEDVLGRDPVRKELERVGAYLEDRVVLVTGAGGSIGAELSRQIAQVRPRLLVLLDHAEDNLFQIEREMTEQWHFSACEAVLADCKEGDRMLEVMQRFRPEVVFHAAAYKHVGLMEMNPLEAIRNNAMATKVTAETAAAVGVSRFVLVSTDKAVNPQTVMGASKAMAEWIVAAAGQRHATTRFVTVRFGNVLGSSGSVVPIFRSQIEQGGPVTVTHPEMTRYFMTIPESVQLVITSGDLGAESGEVFVLEMGEPVRILDLARKMIQLAGYDPDADIAIEFTGPRRGEKIHEELFNPDERAKPTSADRIVRAVRAQPLDPDWVETTVERLTTLVAAGDEAGLAARVVELVADRPARSSIEI